MRNPESLLSNFNTARLVVLGDAMLDRYIEGTSQRLCPDAPAPVVDVRNVVEQPGGAANTAANAAALGARVSLFASVGDDIDGHRLLTLAEEQGIDTGSIQRTERSTLSKCRVVADGTVLARIDQGSTSPNDHDGRHLDALQRAIASCDAVIVSDYAYGYCTSTIRELLTDCGVPVIVDAKHPETYARVGATLVTPNFRQMAVLVPGLEEGRDRVEAVRNHRAAVLRATGTRAVAVTLDRDGCALVRAGAPVYHSSATPIRTAGTSGAGDTFSAAVGVSLAVGSDMALAVEFATTAAAVAVAKEGTARCSTADLRVALAPTSKLVDSPERMREVIELQQAAGMRVVFTSGCFDILHSGHIAFLGRARRLGDHLVVGINSDASVRRLKGECRPINALPDRMAVLAALSCVDHLVAFDETTPEHLLSILRPDIFAKGGDYTIDMLPEAKLLGEMGCEIHLLPYERGYSTTGLIERARGGTSGVPA